MVNGKEYHSLDDMPEAVRAAYEQAMASRAQSSQPSRITFNGKTYDTPEAMPAEVRALYDAAIANLAARGAASGAEPGGVGRAIEPSGVSWYVIALFVGAVVLIGLFLLYRR